RGHYRQSRHDRGGQAGAGRALARRRLAGGLAHAGVLGRWRPDELHGRDESISLAGDRLHEAGLLRVVLERLADLADGGIDAVVRVEEDIPSPDPLDDPVPADELSLLFDEETQDLHGDALQLERPP